MGFGRYVTPFHSQAQSGCRPVNMREVIVGNVWARPVELNRAAIWSPWTCWAVKSIKDGTVKWLRASAKAVVAPPPLLRRQREVRDGSWMDSEQLYRSIVK
jgi:hypothetical protein